MKLSIYFVFCVLVNLAAAVKDTYRAAIVRDVGNSDLNAHIPAIYEAGRKNVDILVLPPSETLSSKYDESAREVARAAREADVQVCAHARDVLVCTAGGAAVSLKTGATCNCSTVEESETFVSDFGVEFTLLTEEELALLQPSLVKGRNVIVTGAGTVEVPFLTAWSQLSRANVLCGAALLADGPRLHTDLLTIADVHIHGRHAPFPPPVVGASSRGSGEDLTHYSIKPLDLEASVDGYTETVCQHDFCCQFNIKASSKGSKGSCSSFSAGAHSGRRAVSPSRRAAVQVCGVFHTACRQGAQNSTDVIFSELTVSGNFSDHTVLFPMIVSNDVIDSSQYSAPRQGTVTIRDASVISFGIFGRDFTKDREVIAEKEVFADSDSLFNENVQEFIDYVWIRLRILIFVVSIYILEMM
ncbi:uncharacterized protein LOC115449281 isoform X2 [Manduca sexta]|uniref:uncharacterized protein LOC115449281 isoform X2 n=1 Tax=Manduca sexta TaxID=7130 RepID=UPI00118300FF|nr:uncharacterized protein LOC115449281 isoform X2 [Manduca sexta]